MFKMILSAIVALGFTVVANAQEGAPAPAAPTKMDAAPAAAAPTADAPAKKAKHKHKKAKKTDDAPKAE